MKFAAALLASAALASVAPGGLNAQPRQRAPTPSTPACRPNCRAPRSRIIMRSPSRRTPQRLTFDGKVGIDLDVIKATRELVLNAADLKITSATLAGRDWRSAADRPRDQLDAEHKRQRSSFRADRARRLPPRPSLIRARSTPRRTGCSRSITRTRRARTARSLFTQFEAADARRFVPSFDEPDYKATFDLTARVPANEMAVSNMPAAATRNIGGLKEVRFQTTPIMSSYLLFFAQRRLRAQSPSALPAAKSAL